MFRTRHVADTAESSWRRRRTVEDTYLPYLEFRLALTAASRAARPFIHFSDYLHRNLLYIFFTKARIIVNPNISNFL